MIIKIIIIIMIIIIPIIMIIMFLSSGHQHDAWYGMYYLNVMLLSLIEKKFLCDEHTTRHQGIAE